MEAKEAYQQLLDEREGRARAGGGSSSGGRSGGYGAGRAGSASAGSSGWGYRGSTGAGGAGSYGRGQQQPRWQPQEEAYSFGALAAVVAGLATRFGGPVLLCPQVLALVPNRGGAAVHAACASTGARPLPVAPPPPLHGAAAVCMP